MRTYLWSEMPNGKMKKKIGTFLLYSYFFLYNRPPSNWCYNLYRIRLLLDRKFNELAGYSSLNSGFAGLRYLAEHKDWVSGQVDTIPPLSKRQHQQTCPPPALCRLYCSPIQINVLILRRTRTNCLKIRFVPDIRLEKLFKIKNSFDK